MFFGKADCLHARAYAFWRNIKTIFYKEYGLHNRSSEKSIPCSQRRNFLYYLFFAIFITHLKSDSHVSENCCQIKIFPSLIRKNTIIRLFGV